MFNRIFDSITSGLSKFVLIWAMPSALSVGIFAVFVFPAVRTVPPFSAVGDAAGHDPVSAAAVLGFAVASLSVLFAYSNLPIYRFLEGYTLPWFVRNRLLKRQRRRWAELHRYAGHPAAAASRKRLDVDHRLMYPDRCDNVLPTRLGNALRALETYGGDRFGLDSQTFWHELVGCAPQRVKDQVDQTRGAVDLFVSTVAHLTLLGVASLLIGILVAPSRPHWQSILIGLVAFAAIPFAYGSAVRSVLDWRFATQALIHTGRSPLAEQLGFRLPEHAEDEWCMWLNFRKWVVEAQVDAWVSLDKFRPPPSDSSSDATSSTSTERS